MSAIQLPTVRVAVLAETGPNLYRSSRLSRLAEQLGWAIRQIRPDLVDPDCLRNAVNAFFYRDPQTLPPTAPATQLSSEPHAFSRVFTGAYFQALAGMLAIEAGDQAPTPDRFEAVSVAAGQLLIDAVIASPVVPEFMSQVAGHVIQADAQRFNGKYSSALKSGFLAHGVLSLDAVSALVAAPRAMAAAANGSAADGSASHVSLPAARYGLTADALLVAAASQVKSLPVRGAAPALVTSSEPSAPEPAAAAFVDHLFQRGRIDVGDFAPAGHSAHRRHRRATHELVRQDGALVLKRRLFDCGLGLS